MPARVTLYSKFRHRTTTVIFITVVSVVAVVTPFYSVFVVVINTINVLIAAQGSER